MTPCRFIVESQAIRVDAVTGDQGRVQPFFLCGWSDSEAAADKLFNAPIWLQGYALAGFPIAQVDCEKCSAYEAKK